MQNRHKPAAHQITSEPPGRAWGSVNYKMNDGWKAWLQGRNLANQLYADSASSSYSGTGAYTPSTQDQYTVGASLSVMLGLTYTFDVKKK